MNGDQFVTAKDAFEQAIYVLHSTGLPDTVITDRARTVSDIEGLTFLINALIGSGIPEAVEAGSGVFSCLCLTSGGLF